MNILWFTWKDKKNPLAGGAEVMNEELATRMVKDGHSVILLVGGFLGGTIKEKINGYTVIRVGNRWSVYWEAYRYYKKNLANWADIYIEEINTIPFFTQFYVPTSKKKFLLIYQLCREIWFYQMFFPLSLIGYVIEPLYLRLLSGNKVITESESTKIDLQQYGYKKNRVSVVLPGSTLQPVHSLSSVKKYKDFTVISIGTIRSMKQTLDQIKAFEIAKSSIPELKMVITGSPDGMYGKRVLKYIAENKYSKDISYLGKVSEKVKLDVMSKGHVILVSSIKEGWGLIVTEANSQGTPAIVYDVDGLRDSVQDGVTGIITNRNTSEGIAEEIGQLYTNKQLYRTLQKNAYVWSKQLTFDNSYKQFKKVLGLD
jgi:glycosyltransferase involved in cell wall biosynthesis